VTRDHLEPEPEPADAPALWDAGEYANWLYDVLSDALRERADVFPDTYAAFAALDDWLRGGGVLPGPWRDAERPPSTD